MPRRAKLPAGACGSAASSPKSYLGGNCFSHCRNLFSVQHEVRSRRDEGEHHGRRSVVKSMAMAGTGAVAMAVGGGDAADAGPAKASPAAAPNHSFVETRDGASLFFND